LENKSISYQANLWIDYLKNTNFWSYFSHPICKVDYHYLQKPAINHQDSI
jgi:hypothetical protein